MDTSESMPGRAADNIRNFDQTFNSDASSVLHDPNTEKTDLSPETKRPLPYFINKNEEPTAVKPVMAGIHINDRGVISFTLRYPDGLYYQQVPSIQKAGQLPFKKGTQMLKNRCRNTRTCKAKSLVEWMLDMKILEEFKDMETYENHPNLWDSDSE